MTMLLMGGAFGVMYLGQAARDSVPPIAAFAPSGEPLYRVETIPGDEPPESELLADEQLVPVDLFAGEEGP